MCIVSIRLSSSQEGRNQDFLISKIPCCQYKFLPLCIVVEAELAKRGVTPTKACLYFTKMISTSLRMFVKQPDCIVGYFVYAEE